MLRGSPLNGKEKPRRGGAGVRTSSRVHELVPYALIPILRREFLPAQKIFQRSARGRRHGGLADQSPLSGKLSQSFTSIPQTIDISKSRTRHGPPLNATPLPRISAGPGLFSGPARIVASLSIRASVYRLLTIFRQYRNVGTPSDIRSKHPPPAATHGRGFLSLGAPGGRAERHGVLSAQAGAPGAVG